MNKEEKQAIARTRAIYHHLNVMQGRIPQKELGELLDELEELKKITKKVKK